MSIQETNQTLEIIKTLAPFVIAVLGILSPLFTSKYLKNIELKKHKQQLLLEEKIKEYKYFHKVINNLCFDLMRMKEDKSKLPHLFNLVAFKDLCVGFIFISEKTIKESENFLENAYNCYNKTPENLGVFLDNYLDQLRLKLKKEIENAL